jgi:hypothetical protein
MHGRIWSVNDDVLLCDAVEKEGDAKKNWKRIAESVPGKTYKQCYTRWYDHVKPGIRHDVWSEDETSLLMLLVALHGRRWVFISNYLTGRTANSAKNKYVSRMCQGHLYPPSLTTKKVKKKMKKNTTGGIKFVLGGHERVALTSTGWS